MALGAAGAGLILLREANYGVGLSEDSVYYISTAQSLLAGNGWDSDWGIYTRSAPLFPLVLAGIGAFGVDIIPAAGYVNAAAFGLTGFIITRWLRRRIRSRFLIIWAGGASLLALPLAYPAMAAVTEPLFILFVTLSLFTLDNFLDNGKLRFLLLAAICAALACSSRYIGVTLVASTVILLILQRGSAWPVKAKNALIYAGISMVPICLWLLRNFLVAGEMAGKPVPTDFSVLSSLDSAGSELLNSVFGNMIAGYLNIALVKVFGAAMTGDATVAGVGAKMAILFGVTVGVGYVLLWLHRRGYCRNRGPWTVPAVFVLIYASFLTIYLPVANVNLAHELRYLAPMYPPALVMGVLALNEFLRWASAMRPLNERPLLQRWNTGPAKHMTMSAPALILTICLAGWLLQQAYVNYHNINYLLENGTGYSSRRWAESETVQYLRDNPLDGIILTNRNLAIFYRWIDILAANSMRIDQLNHQIAYAYDVGKDAYIVWFHTEKKPHHGYGLAEIQALPGIETVAILADGIVLKAAFTDSP